MELITNCKLEKVTIITNMRKLFLVDFAIYHNKTTYVATKNTKIIKRGITFKSLVFSGF